METSLWFKLLSTRLLKKRRQTTTAGKELIFKMVEEFDDVFEDDITTLTFTYADDVEIPEIPDTEGIHVVEITNNRLVIKHILDDDEVYGYIKSCGLTSRPIKLSIEFCVYEDSEEE